MSNIKIKLPDKYKHLMDNPGVRDWIKECEHRLNEEFSSEKLQKMSDDFSKASLFGTTYIEIMDGRYIVYPKHSKEGLDEKNNNNKKDITATEIKKRIAEFDKS